ncbi:MAG TPA: DUF4365 domain-containing protein [Pirellulales bacterium]|nr:DUF4365 domain-containing protein [Pirellulales bacterium]
MDLNQRKEQFSHAYVKAVAAVAGFAWYKPSVDDDSIDLGLAQRGGSGTIRSPRLEIQLKCHAMPIPEADDFGFWLDLKNYDDLRDERVEVKRILVVVLVPDDLADYLVENEQQLAMRRCAYWLSLRGFPPTENDTGQTIRISRSQRFTVQSLQGMMERISLGSVP